jgi:hypothetical protein
MTENITSLTARIGVAFALVLIAQPSMADDQDPQTKPIVKTSRATKPNSAGSKQVKPLVPVATGTASGEIERMDQDAPISGPPAGGAGPGTLSLPFAFPGPPKPGESLPIVPAPADEQATGSGGAPDSSLMPPMGGGMMGGGVMPGFTGQQGGLPPSANGLFSGLGAGQLGGGNSLGGGTGSPVDGVKMDELMRTLKQGMQNLQGNDQAIKDLLNSP